MGKIGVILFIVVLLGVGVYLINSGVLTTGFNGINSLITPHSSSTSSSFFNFNFGSSSNFFGPSSPTGPTLPQTIIAAPTPVPTASVINPADIPKGFTAAQLSPYFHEVRLGGVSAGTAYYYGTIVLNTYVNANETIDVTGWQIKSRNSGEYVPQAINIYDPSGLATPSDIRVKSGDAVYLYSSSAPFNVRLNKCIGYIAHVANFVPALPQSCPYVDRSQIQNFTGACQNYITSIGSCQAGDSNNPQVPRNDYACQDYIQNNFNYKSCFSAHVGDTDFLSNQVWVWTGSNVVDQYHDNVELLDRNGLLVDYYTY
jgi:hypothetical protein